MKKATEYFTQILKFIFAGLLIFCFEFSALGQNYTPSVTGDTGVNSLREAIQFSNQDGFNSIIRLQSAQTYTLTILGAEAGDASFFDLDIVNNGTLTIETTGGSLPAIIQANFGTPGGDTRIFDVQPKAKLILNHVIIENGNTLSNGAGIFNNGGTVELISGTILRANISNSSGGGIYNRNLGADIGRIIVDNSTIEDNHANGNVATDGGGGIFNDDGIVRLVSGTIIQNNIATNNISKGGGVLNTNSNAILRVRGSIITRNEATSGAGICNNQGANTLIFKGSSTISLNSASASGGGIYNANAGSIVTILSATLLNNFAVANGGGIYSIANATLNITCASIVSNIAPTSDGGGIFTDFDANTTIRNSLISQNRANRGGGIAIFNGATVSILNNSIISLNSGTNGGGGIFNGGNNPLIIASATISNNQSNSKGGGIFNNTGAILTITCSSIISNTSNSNGGGICNEAGAQITLGNSFISLNLSSGGLGTGIFNQGQATVSHTYITYNQGNIGAGIFNGFGGTMSLINGCDISYNVANSNDGGGIAQFSGGSTMVISSATITNNTANNGGGIFNKKRMDITASSISNNTGGGIYHEQNAGGQDLTIINSTISSNFYTGQGGGIRVVNVSSLIHLNHVSIANNKGVNFGAIANPNNARINLENSIIGNNISPTDVQGLGISPTIVSSIVADGSVTDPNILNIDPKLDILQVFSGSLIHRLLPTSPALNAGIVSAITLDQIGRLRDAAPDIGAYEGVLPCVNVTLPTGIDNIWLGCLSNDWFNGNNWSQGTVPSSSHVILLLSSSPTLVINANVSCRKIIAQKGTKYYVTKGSKIFFTSP